MRVLKQEGKSRKATVVVEASLKKYCVMLDIWQRVCGGKKKLNTFTKTDTQKFLPVILKVNFSLRN